MSVPHRVQPSRAAALEALGELRAALRDYRDLHRSSPGVGNAGEAVKRIEKARAAQRESACAIPESCTLPSQALGIVPAAPASASGGRRVQLTEEEAKSLSEVQARFKDVSRQRVRALEQVRAAQREKRHVELTVAQLGQVPETAGVFRPVGRAFIKSTHAELGTVFGERMAKLSQRVKACESAAAYLDAQHGEAEAAQAELMRTLQARAS